MSHAIVPVELPEPLMRDAAEIAEESGMSVANWITFTVEQRLKNERLTREFFRRRALGGTGTDLLAMLDKSAEREPDPGDEL